MIVAVCGVVQGWARRVAQLETALDSEGEHVKTLLGQRDALAVRKVGLGADLDERERGTEREWGSVPTWDALA